MKTKIIDGVPVVFMPKKEIEEKIRKSRLLGVGYCNNEKNKI